MQNIASAFYNYKLFYNLRRLNDQLFIIFYDI